jgi:hypothetical protein
MLFSLIGFLQVTDLLTHIAVFLFTNSSTSGKGWGQEELNPPFFGLPQVTETNYNYDILMSRRINLCSNYVCV